MIGIAAGVICFWAATSLKHLLGYDDSLDAFGVHGIGGMVGAILTGWFSFGPLSATDASPDGSAGGLAQVWLQCQGVASTIVYSGIGTFVILMVVKVTPRTAGERRRGTRRTGPRPARRTGILNDRFKPRGASRPRRPVHN